MKSKSIDPADDTAASGILRLRCSPNEAPAAYCEPRVKPLPREPATLAELADAYRGLADVVGIAVAALIGRGGLDPDFTIDGLTRQAAIMRKLNREFRAQPLEFCVQEITELLKRIGDMAARTQAAPSSKQ
jgi:hypothetical protein